MSHTCLWRRCRCGHAAYCHSHTTTQLPARARRQATQPPKRTQEEKERLGAEALKYAVRQLLCTTQRDNHPSYALCRTVLPPYNGDTFGVHGDYSDSLVYLSRYVRPQVRGKFKTFEAKPK